VDDAVMRALEKLPADRWSSARQFADALQGGSAGAAPRGDAAASRQRTAVRGAPRRSRWRDPVVLALVAIALASVVVAAWSQRRGPASAPRIVRFTIPAPPDARSNSLGLNTLAISRDGRSLVYIGQDADRRPLLVLRTLDDVTPRPLPGTEDGNSPIFSPDGRWVAFVRGNQLFKIPVDGNRPQLLTPLPGTFAGMSWSSTGVIVVSGNLAMYAVPDVGGPPRQLGKPDRSVGEVDQDNPLVLDDDGVYLYASTRSSAVNTSRIAIATLENGRQTVFDLPGAQPLGIVDGVLVYAGLDGAVMGVPFDIAKRRVSGRPVQLGVDVAINATTGLARAAMSRDGTLFYAGDTQTSQVVMVGLDGSTQVLLSDPRAYAFPRLSPDGRRLAVAIGSADRRDVWLDDIATRTMTRLTNGSATNDRPEWTPDGTRVVFHSDRTGRSAIWWRPADLSAEASPLVAGPKIDVFEAVISPDMRNVVYQLDTTGADLLYRSLGGDSTPHVVANDGHAIETMPRLSPDGRFVAFITDESGQNEVVVQPFPGPGGRLQVSTGGGSEPVWSRDGKRLYYRGDGHLMVTTLTSTPTLAVATRDTVLTDDYQFAGNPHANYDVASDGAHFVFLKGVGQGNMIVATNWSSLIRPMMSGVAAK
jgi:serine/threonine-protein kinase